MIKTLMTKSSLDAGLLVIRAGLGIQFILHGWPKLMGGPEKWAKLGGVMANFGLDFAPSFWGFNAAMAEFGGGLLLILGLLTRPALVFMAFTMFIAGVNHIMGSMKAPVDPEKPVSALQHYMSGSHALELMIVFIGLLLIGAGRYSLDHMLFASKTPASPADAGTGQTESD